jgi:hypothetical protein
MRNRVSVTMNWAWSYLTWDRGPRLLLETPRIRPARAVGQSEPAALENTTEMPVARVEQVNRTVA